MLSRPSWIPQPWKNNSGCHFEVHNTIQFQPDPSRGLLVITSGKNITDGQDENIYASSLLDRGIINTSSYSFYLPENEIPFDHFSNLSKPNCSLLGSTNRVEISSYIFQIQLYRNNILHLVKSHWYAHHILKTKCYYKKECIVWSLLNYTIFLFCVQVVQLHRFNVLVQLKVQVTFRVTIFSRLYILF